MQREPPPFVWAAPDEKDILTCALIVTLTCATYSDYTYRELHHRTSHQHIIFTTGIDIAAAWTARLSLHRWRISWCPPIPVRVPFQAARHQGSLIIYYSTLQYTHTLVAL